MKKILILSAVFSVSIFSLSAQQSNSLPGSVGAESKTVKAKVATINGIPYSQYKAQQDALKNKQQTTQSATAPVITTAKPGIAVVDAQAATTPTTPKVTIEKPTGVQPAPDAKSALVPEAPKEPVKAEKGKG